MNPGNDERFHGLAFKVLMRQATTEENAELELLLEGNPKLRHEFEELGPDVVVAQEVAALVAATDATHGVLPAPARARILERVRSTLRPPPGRNPKRKKKGKAIDVEARDITWVDRIRRRWIFLVAVAALMVLSISLWPGGKKPQVTAEEETQEQRVHYDCAILLPYRKAIMNRVAPDYAPVVEHLKLHFNDSEVPIFDSDSSAAFKDWESTQDQRTAKIICRVRGYIENVLSHKLLDSVEVRLWSPQGTFQRTIPVTEDWRIALSDAKRLAESKK